MPAVKLWTVVLLALTLSAHVQRTFGPFTAEPREVAFTPDGAQLAIASVDRTVKLFHIPDGALTRTLTHPAGVTSVAMSSDGQWIVTGSYDGTVRLWRDGLPAR